VEDPSYVEHPGRYQSFHVAQIFQDLLQLWETADAWMLLINTGIVINTGIGADGALMSAKWRAADVR
jgi:hypothetical protein